MRWAIRPPGLRHPVLYFGPVRTIPLDTLLCLFHRLPIWLWLFHQGFQIHWPINAGAMFWSEFQGAPKEQRRLHGACGRVPRHSGNRLASKSLTESWSGRFFTMIRRPITSCIRDRAIPTCWGLESFRIIDFVRFDRPAITWSILDLANSLLSVRAVSMRSGSLFLWKSSRSEKSASEADPSLSRFPSCRIDLLENALKLITGLGKANQI